MNMDTGLLSINAGWCQENTVRHSYTGINSTSVLNENFERIQKRNTHVTRESPE